MSHKTIRQFAKEYDGLLLLSHSDASITLGDLYKKKGFFRQRIDFSGYNVAYYALDDAEERKTLKAQLSGIEALPGEFAGVTIKDSFSSEADMALPFINLDLAGKVAVEQFKSFEIGKITTKVLRDANRIAVRDSIKKFRQAHSDEEKDINDFWLAEALFYGAEISITIDKSANIDAEADFAEAVSLPSFNLDSDSNHVFTFEGCADYPFAMDLKKVKNI